MEETCCDEGCTAIAGRCEDARVADAVWTCVWRLFAKRGTAGIRTAYERRKGLKVERRRQIIDQIP